MKALAVGLWFIDFPFVSVITVPTLFLFVIPIQHRFARNFDRQCPNQKERQKELAHLGFEPQEQSVWSFMVIW